MIDSCLLTICLHKLVFSDLVVVFSSITWMFTWLGWCLASVMVFMQRRSWRAVEMLCCVCLKTACLVYQMHSPQENHSEWSQTWGLFAMGKVADFPPFAGEGNVLHVQTCSERKVFAPLKCLVQRGRQPVLTLALQRAELGQGLNESWGRLEKSALFFLINLPKSFSGNAVDGNIAALSEG